MNVVYIEKAYDRLVFLGDIHGQFGIVKYKIRTLKLKDTVIVQVGDFGIGFGKDQHEEEELRTVNALLIRSNCFLIAIRGNHDNPAYFNNQYYKSNVLLMQDYTVARMLIGTGYVNMLGIGGAISVDRVPRQINGWGWFPGENVVINRDLEFLNAFKNIHFLVTHTAPDDVEPYSFNHIVYSFAQNDPTLLDDLRKERREFFWVLKPIIENNFDTLKEHFYGHFHYSAVSYAHGVKHTLLNVEELKEANVQVHNYFGDDGEGAQPSDNRSEADGEGPVA